MDFETGAKILGGTLGGSALTALITTLFSRRKVRAEATMAEVATNATLFDRVETLQGRVLALTDRADNCDRENAQLRIDIEQLRRSAPFALTAHQLIQYERFGDLFDEMSDGLMITSPANGGEILWVNTFFHESIGYSREEVIRRGWRGLLHEDDMRPTESAETSASGGRLWGFPNRYIHANGEIVWWRWFTLGYIEGRAIALARKVGALASNEPMLPIRRRNSGPTAVLPSTTEPSTTE